MPPPQHKSSPAPVHKATPAAASTTSPVTAQQKTTSSWNNDGKTYYRYSTIVTNKSSKILKDLKISVNNLYGSIWGLTKSKGVYTLPNWLSSLPAGKSLEFVYIHASTPAELSLPSVESIPHYTQIMLDEIRDQWAIFVQQFM